MGLIFHQSFNDFSLGLNGEQKVTSGLYSKISNEKTKDTKKQLPRVASWFVPQKRY